MTNVTDIFVNTIYQMANSPIPEKVYDEARKCVLDLLGSMIGGTVWMKDRLNSYLDLMSENGGSTVVGFGRKASMQNATLVNGMCAHVFDMDDGHRFSTVHLGATVIPATLTVCERYDLGMEDLLRGVIMGYETGVRLGRCLQPAHRDRGFHATGTIGTIAATMAVATALRFTKDEYKNALAAATSSAAGNLRMDKGISTLKPYNAGRAGHDGITAALIGKVGFISPENSLEDQFGWLSAMAEKYDASGLDIANDANYNILGAYHKPYAACRHTHAAIDGVLGLKAEGKLNPDDIEKILVRMYRQGVKGHDAKDIPTAVAGKMSIPYCVALALVKGSAGMHDFTEENVLNPQIVALTKKTDVVADEEMTAWVPRKRPACLEITLKDGTKLVKMVDFATGEPELPMSMESFTAKFMDLAEYGGKTEAEAKKIHDTVLESNGKVKELMALMQ